MKAKSILIGKIPIVFGPKMDLKGIPLILILLPILM